MKIFSGGVDTIMTEKNCSFALDTRIGRIRMYGEIINGEIRKEAIGPSFPYKDKYNELTEDEKDLAIDAVYNELKNYR